MTSSRARAIAALFVLACSWASTTIAETTDAQMERLNEVVKGMLLNLAGDPLFADFSPEDWDILLNRPSERVDSFGLIVSPRPGAGGEGLLVLGVTPGSPAARMGVRSGDRVLTFNGHELRGRDGGDSSQSTAYHSFRSAVSELEDGAPVQLEIARGDRVVVRQGAFERLFLPSVSLQLSGSREDSIEAAADDESSTGCAMVTVSEAPPRDFDIFRAQITAINGDRAGATLRSTHYLVPGAYSFTLQEHIPGHELATELQRFAERRPPLELGVELKADQVYHLGAKLLKDRRDQSRDEPYWEPIVWKMEPGRCTGRPVDR